MRDGLTLVDVERHLRRENLLTALQLAGAWSPASQARLERLAFEEFGEGCAVDGLTLTEPGR